MSQAQSKNAWRSRSEGPKSWSDKLHPGSKNKYFIVTCDAHINEPVDFWADRIDQKFRSRLPHLKTEPDGTQWLISECYAPALVKIPRTRTDLLPPTESFENWDAFLPYDEKMEEEDILRTVVGRTPEMHLRDSANEGVDAEIMFPTKGLMAFGSSDPEFVVAMCKAVNRWALDNFKDHFGKLMPMALIPVCHVEEAIKEVQWAAANGFHGLLLPNRPNFNRLDQLRAKPEYNDKSLEPLWSAIEEVGLTITMHVATSNDPRAVGGKGGAIINYVGAVSTTTEPITTLIASGVFERHRKLKLAAIESGIGWIPWLLYQMDNGHKAHHMWVRPVLPNLPSDYFREHCSATFIEEKEALNLLVQMGYENNLLWSNDYPHPEGSFPHSRVTIERSMGELTDEQRAKVLGLNAARLFGIKA